MILSMLTTVAAAGVVGYTYFVQSGSPSPSKSDAKKNQRIFVNRGLSVKEGKNIRTIQQLRRRDIPGGKEYVFRIPLGLSYEDFSKQLSALQDGLNNRRQRREITLNDIKAIRRFKDIIELWQREPERVNKEIEMNYDGVLKIKVYDEPLPDQFTYTNETATSCKGWQIPVGYNRTGLIKHDFADIPHLLVAGATGKGKSVFLKSIVSTLISNQPKHLQLTLIDLKGGLDFSPFARCRQPKTLAKDVEEAYTALVKIREHMEQRMNFMLSNGYEDVSEMGEPTRHFIVIDEAAELSSAGESDPNLKKMKVACEALSDITRRGRAVGLSLVYATQYPTNETQIDDVRFLKFTKN
ncbi:FtsK/SpoIIIE domain-containing protein [Alkalicoccobacillus porphyridii]|uniref:Cell division protein FtsK n=1 Tax=Alkalicoccobacillus porphyridii TaxID=2597270 RepID=A0A553ZUD7_9BACI|nr:FtsK/SpoIIIE domain-containing protein [Alkalicoccobacillus porphyridii]TSB44916.1 cell division protein FtsK [Alkalicoccobacillus porphyridii]